MAAERAAKDVILSKRASDQTPIYSQHSANVRRAPAH